MTLGPFAAGRPMPKLTISPSADNGCGQFLQLLLIDSSFIPERNACLLTFIDAGGVDFVRSFCIVFARTSANGLVNTSLLEEQLPDGRPTNRF
jgi:hypothetical protein